MLSHVIDITALREAEQERQKFVSLVDQSSEFIGMCSMDMVPLYINEAGKQLVGLDSHEDVCQFKILDFVVAEDREIVSNYILPKVSREGKAEAEIRFRHFKTGETIWMVANVFPIYDLEGRPVCLATVSRNISQLKRAANRLDLLADAANSLLMSDSPFDVVETICEKVMSFLGCHIFFNYKVDTESDRYRLAACCGISGDVQRKLEWLDSGDNICNSTVRNACRIIIEDIPSSTDPRIAVVKSLDIYAYVCIPIIAQERVIGTLSFGTRDRRRISDDELTMMNIIADQIAIATDRMQKVADMKSTHDFLEQRVIERTEELVSSVLNLQKELVERERAEESLRRLARLYSVLTETNLAIVRTADRDSIFHDFCRIAVEHGKFLLSLITLVNDDNGRLEIAASCGDLDYLEQIGVTRQNESAWDDPNVNAIRLGTFFISNDFQKEYRGRYSTEKMSATCIKASASVALKENGRVIGGLMLYAGEKDFFDQQHVNLLLQMGVDISFALDNLNRESARREAERALHDETRERLKIVEALREKEQLLVQQTRLAAMGDMIGNIAHQWRQPLNVLGLMIQQLVINYDTGKFNREILKKNVSSAMTLIKHMSQTIDDFMNFFRPDKERVSFSVKNTISKSLQLMEGSFKKSQIEIEVTGSEDAVISGYRNQFAQAVLNILQNAYEELIHWGIDSPRVKIGISTEDNKVVITIADNAGGIPEAIIRNIFEPYFTTKGSRKGTGIGLYMSKNIIENNMGGSLTVCNINGGAEFRIEV